MGKIRIDDNKELTQDLALKKAPLSKEVFIPLLQHIGKPCISLVKPGEYVYLGQMIATQQAQVFAPVHSSVSGKVLGIRKHPHPIFGQTEAVVIENDFLDRPFARKQYEPAQISKLSAAQLREIVFAAGIVGMGGAGFPAHIKLSPPKPVGTLIVNGAECEPWVTSDARLMVEHTKEIILGIEIVQRILGTKQIFVAIEENKPQAIRAFQKERANSAVLYQVVCLRGHYPQGGEKQLIKSILKKEVPIGKLPFEIGVVVHNVATLYAIYEAVYKQKPLYERAVTLTGTPFSCPQNLWVRIGTPIQHLIDYCGLKEKPAKVILGGPMMGLSQCNLQVPVIKTTGAVVLLGKQEIDAYNKEETVCIRCGACVRNCPVGLAPALIDLCSRNQKWQEAAGLFAKECIECGLCSYVCPSHRHLTQSIKQAKLALVK